MTGNDYVDAISEIAFEGNIIPWSWYKTLRLPSGKPDLVAIMILADVIYWYRAAPIHDEQSGQVLGWKKKFSADLLQRSHDAYVTQFGFTPKQVKEALYRLETQYGVIRRERRTINTISHGRIGNVLFLAPVIEAIQRVTHPRPLGHRSPKDRTQMSQGRDIEVPSSTKTSSETSTKISHKCPSDIISVTNGAKKTTPFVTHTRSTKQLAWTGHYWELLDDPQWPLVQHCLARYYQAYRNWKGRAHPRLKKPQLLRCETVLSEAFDAYGIDCEASVDALVATYWVRSFVTKEGAAVTDRNLNAFATETVLMHLAQTIERAGLR